VVERRGVEVVADPDADLLASACVLVVDDGPTNVALLDRLLRSAGVLDIHTVTDPRQAVSLCLEVDADVVLLDLHMPDYDGFAVMAELSEALPPDAFVPVLVLTGDVTTPTRDRALKAGAKDFLTKPFDLTEVMLRVRNLLQTRALYLDVQRHNEALRADLARRAEQEQRNQEQRRSSEERVDRVVTNGVLSMVFQPVAELETGRLVGVEALARFATEPRRPPNEWFEEAAAIGRGTELELVAVGRALGAFSHLPGEVFLSLNVSPATASAARLAELVEEVGDDRIVLELTEHTRVDDYNGLLEALRPLRERGMRVAVDDAGSGYAGLRHILRLRPDILKLDLNLIRGCDADPARRALTTAMVTFADEIGATIIAEGIETPAELDTLRSLGIPWGQGYHLARPAPLEEATQPLDLPPGDASP
jgi:EAL domain-containing protein (putative c-di-GMP-specific phosphodiesterase class I)/FixJ family two-component response regulator